MTNIKKVTIDNAFLGIEKKDKSNQFKPNAEIIVNKSLSYDQDVINFNTSKLSDESNVNTQSQNIISVNQLTQLESMLDSSIDELQNEINLLEINNSSSRGSSYNPSETLAYGNSESEKIKQLKSELATLKQLKKQIQYEIELQPYNELIDNKDFKEFVNNYDYMDCGFDMDDLIAKGYGVNLYYSAHIKSAGNDGEYAIDNINDLDQYAIFEFIVDKLDEKMDIPAMEAFGKSSLLNGTDSSGKPYSNPAENYFFMTDNQKNIYHYLFKTEGKESAEHYISLIQDEINMKSGAYYAEQFISDLDLNNPDLAKETLLDYLKVSGKGLTDGIDSFYTGLSNSIIANEQLSSNDYEKMYILQYLREKSNLLDEDYELSQSFGNMIPAMTSGTIISCIGTPVAGAMAGSALMGISAEGNAYRQAKIDGHDEISSRTYGLMVGSSEALLGYFLGKIPGISKTSGFTLGNLFMEGVEEFSQEWLDAGFQAVILGEDVDWSKVPESATKSFIMGVMMAGLTNGGVAIVNIDGKQTSIDVNKTLEIIEQHPDMDIVDTVIIANSSENTELLLQRLYENGGGYGISQDVLTDLINNDHEYWNQLKTKMVEEYGFHESDVQKIFTMIDTAGGGACPYARSVNVIFEFFKDNPQQFEELFGFPLYRENSDGKIVINDAELLLDLYYWGNVVNPEGLIFGTDENGKLFLKDPNQWVLPNGNHYFPQRGSTYDELINYLQYKSKSLSLETESFLNNQSGKNQFSAEEVKTDLQQRLNNGESLSMGLSPMNGTGIVFTNLNNPDEQITVRGGHWIKIVDISDDGIIVSSWGRKCLIKFDDLTSGNVSYNFLSDDITIKE